MVNNYQLFLLYIYIIMKRFWQLVMNYKNLKNQDFILKDQQYWLAHYLIILVLYKFMKKDYIFLLQVFIYINHFIDYDY